MESFSKSVDLSGLHHEIDLLKGQLCSCGHTGECVACKGFEMLRDQAQAVVGAASQPLLLQVGQEAAMKDLAGQMEKLQQKLVADPELQTLMEQLMARVQSDVGGPDELRKLFSQMGFPGADRGFHPENWKEGFNGFGIPDDPGPDAPED